jgi:DNA-binding response OmpR family regulator
MKRILLVDDNESFRRALEDGVRQAGDVGLCAGDGAAALELFRQRRFDVVITDLIMPDKEGIETIIELRRFRPPPSIIAISGGGRIPSEDYLAMARQFGAAATLAKPFPIDDILETVAGVVDRLPKGVSPNN